MACGWWTSWSHVTRRTYQPDASRETSRRRSASTSRQLEWWRRLSASSTSRAARYTKSHSADDIGLVAQDHLTSGHRKVEGPEHGQQERLQLALRGGLAVVSRCQQLAQHPRARPPPPARLGQRHVEVAQGNQPHGQGVVESAFCPLGMDGTAQVHDGPGRPCSGDAVDDSDMGGREATGLVQRADPGRSATTSLTGYLDGTRIEAGKPPQRCCRVIRRHRSRSGCQHRRQQRLPPGGRRPWDAVHVSGEPLPLSGLEPAVDQATSKAGVDGLSPGDQAFLAFGQRAEWIVDAHTSSKPGPCDIAPLLLLATVSLPWGPGAGNRRRLGSGVSARVARAAPRRDRRRGVPDRPRWPPSWRNTTAGRCGSAVGGGSHGLLATAATRPFPGQVGR